MKHKLFPTIREMCSRSFRPFLNSSARKIRRERKEIRTEFAKWKKDIKRRGGSHFEARENHRLLFQDGPLFKVSSLVVVIFTLVVFCFGFVCDSQGSSNFELALVEDVVLQVKDAVNPKQAIYQPTSKTEKVLGVETYQGEQVAPNVFSSFSFLIAIASGAILYFLWRRRKRKQETDQSDISDASFIAKQNHKGVYAYFVGALAILIILKSMKASFIQDTIELFITFLPLIIIVVVSLVSYYRYLKEPIKGTEIRKKTLTEILYLLLITLIFYILFSPSSFLPMLTAFQKFLRSFLAVENIFLLLSYFLILFLTFSLIWFFIRLYQKSKGSYAGSIQALARKELYCSFALFAFVFLMTFFAFPKAYSPFTDVLGDSLYTASQGNIRLFKANPSSYEKKSIGDLIRGVKNAFSETGSNIGDSIKQVNTKFVQDLKDTKDNLNNSIAQASKDISETLSQDISKKLNLNGGTLDGSLTIRGGITVEDSSYFGDLYPENDDLYDLGLPSKQWKNFYVRRIHGSKGVTIGNSSSNHSLGSSDDFLVSGDFETKGTAYFDGKVDMDSNNIVNLADPKEEQDAATKTYVDNMVGSGAFFSRSGNTISVSNSGDTLNMDGGLIRNIGSSDTYFSMGGGLTLANILYITSGGADIAGDTTIAGILTITGGNLVLGGNTITTTNNTLVSNLNADLLDGQHATYFMPLSYLDTDDLLAADSNSKVASQKAVKTYIDNSIIDNSIATENLWDRNGSALSAHNSGDKILISRLEAENANGLKLYDDGENGIFIKDGGYVGIGTILPESLLHISQSKTINTSIGNIVSIDNTSTTPGDISRIQLSSSEGDSTRQRVLLDGGLYGTSGGYFSIWTRPDGSGMTEKLRILGNGYVGIGTTSPGSTLDIQAAGASQQIKSTTGTNSAYTNYANTGGTFRIGQDKSTGGGLLTDSAAYAGVIAHIGNYPLQFGTNNSIRMTVSNDGNVGIGTTSPNQKLDVNGNINTSGDLIVTNSDPTLVFASTSVGASVGAIHQSGNILSLGTLGLTDMFSLDLATGYVGIGTTAPLANLDINGDLRLSPQSTAPDAQEGKVYYDANDKSYKLYNGQETVAGEYIDLVADPHIQPTECPTGYVSVPGDARYGTAGGFCVMKYEAKCAATDDPTTGLTSPDTGYQTYANNTTACTSANSKQVVSTASGYPIANISQTDAKTYCSNLGEGYHLITNSEWMTIARNIEKRGENWTSGTVGTNGLYRGHSDNTPTTALAANSDDSEGYEGTGNSSPSQEKRTFALSNGEVIWDLSGNVYEWNQDTIKRKDEPHSTTAPDNTFGWKEFTTVDNYGTVSYASMRPSNPNWNATQNMGMFYTYNPSGDTNTTQYAFLRGGSWRLTTGAGLFTLYLVNTPAYTYFYIGLRCVFTP